MAFNGDDSRVWIPAVPFSNSFGGPADDEPIRTPNWRSNSTRPEACCLKALEFFFSLASAFAWKFPHWSTRIRVIFNRYDDNGNHVTSSQLYLAWLIFKRAKTFLFFFCCALRYLKFHISRKKAAAWLFHCDDINSDFKLFIQFLFFYFSLRSPV